MIRVILTTGTRYYYSNDNQVDTQQDWVYIYNSDGLTVGYHPTKLVEAIQTKAGELAMENASTGDKDRGREA